MSIQEIRFLTQFQHLQDLMKAKESFEESHPNVRIIVEQVADNFESMRAFQSDLPPDIMDSGGWELCNKQEFFVDLMPFIKKVENLEEDLNSGIMRVARCDGALRALPIDVSVPLILINKEKFDRAGLAYPTENWSWDEMRQLARQLTIRNEQGVATQFGFGNGVDIEFFEPFVMRNGGRYLSPDGSTARGYIDSDPTIEAIQKIVELYRVDQAIRKPIEPSEAGQLHQGFAMIFAFTWFVGDLIYHNIAEKFEVIGLPQMPGNEQSNMIYMGGCGITSKSKQPELAWEFIRHYILERPERFRMAWNLPITRSLAVQSGMTEHRIWSRYLNELEKVQASAFYLSEKWNSSRQLINEDLTKMIVEGANVRQIMRSWTRFA